MQKKPNPNPRLGVEAKSTLAEIKKAMGGKLYTRLPEERK